MAENKEIDGQSLIEEYPFLIIGETPAKYNWYDCIPDGWRAAFGLKMVKELKNILIKASKKDNIDWIREYKIDDVKEKWGYLHWYATVPSCVYEEYCEWEAKYETISFNTCIECGAPADGYTTGWMVPICAKCAKKHNRVMAPKQNN